MAIANHPISEPRAVRRGDPPADGRLPGLLGTLGLDWLVVDHAYRFVGEVFERTSLYTSLAKRSIRHTS